jgi:SAM-dependent methyltransferase
LLSLARQDILNNVSSFRGEAVGALTEKMASTDAEQHWWHNGRREIILHLLRRYLRGERQRRRLLYSGECLRDMLIAMQQVGEVTGLESDSEIARAARAVAGMTVVDGALPNVALKNCSFDAIILLDLLNDLEPARIPACLHRCAQLLKPGGLFMLSAPVRPMPWMAFRNRGGNRYSCKDIRRYLEEAGFQIRLLSYYNTLLAPALLIREVRWKTAAHAGPRALKPGPSVNHCFSKILASERRLLPWVHLPYGLSIIAVGEVGQTIAAAARDPARFALCADANG